MPINVGEVNATVRLNVAKEQLVEAQERLAELQRQFAAAGGAATEAGRAIYAAGIEEWKVIDSLTNQVAEYQVALGQAGVSGAAAMGATGAAAAGATGPVNNLGGAAAATATALAQIAAQAPAAAVGVAAVQAQAAPAAAGLANVQQQAATTGMAFGSLENMASRMLLRFAMLYALRESFDFVKGLFTGAEAMVTLSERTDMSIGKLQEFQIAGRDAGIPVTQLDTAINTLQKNLSEFHGGDELYQLGLSFEQIFAMRPDQQLDAVMTALQSIQSPAERARIEIKLLGTDAIDPLVHKYAQLSQAARDSGAILQDASVQALSNSAKAYERAGEGIKTFAGTALDYAQRATAWTGSLDIALYKLATGEHEAAKIMIQEMFGFQQAIEATQAAAAKPVPPLMGQAFIDSLRVEVQLTAEQRDKLKELDQIHELTAANAMRAANVTSDQYRAFIKELQETKKEANEAANEAARYAKAWEEVSSAGEDLQGTLAAMDEELISSIESGLKAGVSQGSLATAYEATATQVRAVAMALHEKEAAQKKAETAAAHAAEVERRAEESAEANWQEYYDLVDSMSGTARDKQVAAVETWLARKIAAAQKAKNDDQDYYDSLEAIASVKIDAIIQKNNELYKFSRQNYVNEAQVAKDTLDDMLKHAGDYTGKEIQLAMHMYSEKLKASAHWVAQANKDVDEKYNHEQKKAKETADMEMLLDDELVSHAEASKRKLAGSSFTYDLSTPEGMAQFHKMNPAATSQWSDAQIEAFAKKGGTLQQLLEKAIINLYGGYNAGGAFGGTPHFQGGVTNFQGGMAVVGESGPETVYLPQGASVAPSTSAGGGITVHNTIYVNGTAADVARKVSDEIMRTLKLNRRFAAA